MIKTNYGDLYRNEQFIRKSDLEYDMEYLLINANLNGLDKEKVKQNLFLAFITLLKQIVPDNEEFYNKLFTFEKKDKKDDKEEKEESDYIKVEA